MTGPALSHGHGAFSLLTVPSSPPDSVSERNRGDDIARLVANSKFAIGDVESAPHRKRYLFARAIYARDPGRVEVGKILPVLVSDQGVTVEKVEKVDRHRCTLWSRSRSFYREDKGAVCHLPRA